MQVRSIEYKMEDAMTTLHTAGCGQQKKSSRTSSTQMLLNTTLAMNRLQTTRDPVQSPKYHSNELKTAPVIAEAAHDEFLRPIPPVTDPTHLIFLISLYFPLNPRTRTSQQGQHAMYNRQSQLMGSSTQSKATVALET